MTHQEALDATPDIAKHPLLFRRLSCGGTPHPNLPPQRGKGLTERFRLAVHSASDRPPQWTESNCVLRRPYAMSLALVATVLALFAQPVRAQDVLTETRVTQFGAWQDAASAIFSPAATYVSQRFSSRTSSARPAVVIV